MATTRSCWMSALALFVSPIVMGCSGSLRVSTVAELERRGTQLCAPVDAGFRVETIDWAPEVRRQFEELARGQAVAVRVANCGWSVVPGCRARVNYEYRVLPLQRHQEDGRSESAIQLGSSDVAPGVSRSSRHIRDVAIAGVRELRTLPSASQLEGACDGATHVIARHMTGAFRVSADLYRSGGFRIPYAGAAAALDQYSIVRQAGDPHACATHDSSGAEQEHCGASIEVEIAPLRPAVPPLETQPVHSTQPERRMARTCVTGNALGCRQECEGGTLASCGALATLCTHGNATACTASAELSLNVWSTWLAGQR